MPLEQDLLFEVRGSETRAVADLKNSHVCV